MNKALVAVMCAGLALSAIAQTVKVIPLSPDEAREAKAIAEAREALDVRDKNLRDKIGNTHLKASQLEQACNGIKGGWGCTLDFEFSDDYKYIVPAKPSTSISPNFGIQWAPANGYYPSTAPTLGPVDPCPQCLENLYKGGGR